ncbi:hypothetical protein STTU_1948 [Streptomyces sp. Tu6071]|nr:hypothetical protein STTU_1948 [Streptomyces sp. Tu6071]
MDPREARVRVGVAATTPEGEQRADHDEDGGTRADAEEQRALRLARGRRGGVAEGGYRSRGGAGRRAGAVQGVVGGPVRGLRARRGRGAGRLGARGLRVRRLLRGGRGLGGAVRGRVRGGLRGRFGGAVAGLRALGPVPVGVGSRVGLLAVRRGRLLRVRAPVGRLSPVRLLPVRLSPVGLWGLLVSVRVLGRVAVARLLLRVGLLLLVGVRGLRGRLAVGGAVGISVGISVRVLRRRRRGHGQTVGDVRGRRDTHPPPRASTQSSGKGIDALTDTESHSGVTAGNAAGAGTTENEGGRTWRR